MAGPDLINATFEGFGAVFILLNIRRILVDRMVRGADWRVIGFFTTWGVWNLYYYPHLGQWFSFLAGMAICAANIVYLALMIHYIRKERRIWLST